MSVSTLMQVKPLLQLGSHTYIVCTRSQYQSEHTVKWGMPAPLGRDSQRHCSKAYASSLMIADRTCFETLWLGGGSHTCVTPDFCTVQASMCKQGCPIWGH